MLIEDLTITVKGRTIVDVNHEEYGCSTYLLNEQDKAVLINKALNFVTGKVKGFPVWSDYDYEEPSSDYYIVVKGDSRKLIDRDMEALVSALNDKTAHIYKIVVEDSLM